MSALQLKLTPLQDEEFSLIRRRGLTAKWPTSWYDSGDNPLRELTVWPIPQAEGAGLELWYYAELDFDNLPPGYLRYLRLALSLELCTEFGIEPSQSLIQNYNEAREHIKHVYQSGRVFNAAYTAKVKNALSRGKTWSIVEMETDTSIPTGGSGHYGNRS